MTKGLVLQDLKDFGFKAMTFPFNGRTFATKKEGATEISIILDEDGLTLFVEVALLLVETCFCAMRNVSFGKGFMFFCSELDKKNVKVNLQTLEFETCHGDSK